MTTVHESLFTEHLTMREQLAPILKTHLGQAHIAGTGPEGKTCRECSKWYPLTSDGAPADDFKYQGDGSGVLSLCPARCNHPIMNKADRLVPHFAEACRLFVQSDSAPAATRKDKRRKKDVSATK